MPRTLALSLRPAVLMLAATLLPAGCPPAPISKGTSGLPGTCPCGAGPPHGRGPEVTATPGKQQMEVQRADGKHGGDFLDGTVRRLQLCFPTGAFLATLTWLPPNSLLVLARWQPALPAQATGVRKCPWGEESQRPECALRCLGRRSGQTTGVASDHGRTASWAWDLYLFAHPPYLDRHGKPRGFLGAQEAQCRLCKIKSRELRGKEARGGPWRPRGLVHARVRQHRCLLAPQRKFEVPLSDPGLTPTRLKTNQCQKRLQGLRPSSSHLHRGPRWLGSMAQRT